MGWKTPKAKFKATVKDSDVFLYSLPVNIPSKQSIELLGEMARVFAGISLSEYVGLPGTIDWVEGDTSGIVCKCDVIAFWMTSKQLEAVMNHELERKMKAKAKS